jgi:2,4-dienoyl-CoA reductase-like NADH-dependent reductase (Old Yellow Enzyme family)
MKNRLMLAPLTNQQSHADGTLSDDEKRWLTLRADGGFGLVMTAAAHVQPVGQGFFGQVGAWSDHHIAGLSVLAAELRAKGALSSVQLHHAGARAEKALIPQPVAPCDDPETGARGLSTREVEDLIEDFIRAAERCDEAGFDGVEIHGAHGYVLAQFLSPEINRRDDAFGGSAQKRARIVIDILQGVRARCRPDFQLGLRLSPERFGQSLEEIRALAGRAMQEDLIDYLDMSLWDVAKAPNEEAYKSRSLMEWFTDIPRGKAMLGVAGKITTAARAQAMLDQGADFVLIGRGAIVHHDFAAQAIANPDFAQAALPVTRAHLAAEGLSPAFIDYMANWKGFVA